VTVDRHRDLIVSEARVRQIEDEAGLVVAPPGAVCRVDGCAADTRLGTLAGGAPMLCEGFGLKDEPCIARWLMETDVATYEDWLDARPPATRDY
jgi:hypothetical protein